MILKNKNLNFKKMEEKLEYKIYQIVCNITGEVYYGSTIRTLGERLTNHKTSLACSSKQIILRGNYYIKQINSTFDKEESVKLERYYIQNFECININIPGKNKEEDKAYRENYRKVNKDFFIYYHKDYYEKNKEKIALKKKEWCEKNKEKISLKYKEQNKKKEKYTCECGSIIKDKRIHEKSKNIRHILI